jgi:hypothetical protein
MNERIKELESQCWEARQYGPPWFNAKKFAELIVRECYLWAKENGGLGGEEDFEALKEHFGVE